MPGAAAAERPSTTPPINSNGLSADMERPLIGEAVHSVPLVTPPPNVELISPLDSTDFIMSTIGLSTAARGSAHRKPQFEYQLGNLSLAQGEFEDAAASFRRLRNGPPKPASEAPQAAPGPAPPHRLCLWRFPQPPGRLLHRECSRRTRSEGDRDLLLRHERGRRFDDGADRWPRRYMARYRP